MKNIKIPYIVIILFLSFSNFSYSEINPNIIYNHDIKKEKLVALTFDDGPDLKYTKDILDILKKYNIKATFFVVGDNIDKNPDLLKRELDEGHEVENHTYTHPDLKKCSDLEIVSEILIVEQKIKNITKKRPIYFRPPKGSFNVKTIDIIDIYGYETVLWGVCVENNNLKSAKAMAQRVIDKAKPGIIILAHDGRLDRSKTVEALPLIIKGYKKKGYKFVTLEELLNYKEKED